MALFWEQGYDQVNQQQMAKATGLSTSSLYNTFGTKAQTYERVMERYYEEISRMLAPLEEGRRGIEDLLEFVGLIEMQLRGPFGASGCLFVMSTASLAGRSDISLHYATEHRERAKAAVEATLTRARELGEHVPDPEVAATMMVATFQGILGLARATAAGEEVFRTLDAVRVMIRSWA
jgi:AcrR family transcriptional regulator